MMGNDYHSKNSSFVVYKEWEEYIDLLDSDEDVGKLFRALMAFAKRGDDPDFTGALKMAYTVMKNAIDRDGKKWDQICESRSVSGKQGGRPANSPRTESQMAFDEKQKKQMVFEEKQKNQKVFDEKQKKQKKPKAHDNVYVNVNVSDNDSDSVSVSVNENVLVLGKHHNINLTTQQQNQLFSDYGVEKIEEYIDRVSVYIFDHKCRPYSNHYETIQKWLEKDGVEKLSDHSYDLAAFDDFSLTHTPKLDGDGGG